MKKKYVIRFSHNNYFTGFYAFQGCSYPCESYNNGRPPKKFANRETAEKYLKQIRAIGENGEIVEVDE